jgi:hypothetical protein
MSDHQMLEEHRRTWHDFTRLVTISTAGVIVVLALMAIFLV